MNETNRDKMPWRGRILSVQPRIRLMRSFDERSHTYLGYTLQVEGIIGDEKKVFIIALGKGVHSKHQFRTGNTVSGMSLPVSDPRTETAEYYKTSKLKIIDRGYYSQNDAPPYHMVPPSLEVYRERGHRRLDSRTYGSKCKTCIWGCLMPVEIIVDHWNPSNKNYSMDLRLRKLKRSM
ncbi:MAG: hypothetical protein JSW20_05635 [Nitrospiraceae bacterium]|nr:MAG: hypothetical protein JSW20_05635 [Nitrospiraceae bacterium]